MKNTIKNVLNMIRVVVLVLKNELAIISTISKLLAAYNELKLLLTKIEETAQNQMFDTTGLTMDKSVVKGLLANALAKVCSATMVFASETSNLLLKKTVKYTESKLVRLSDEILIEVSGIIYKKCNSIKADLVDYGIIDDDFTLLSNLRDTFIILNPSVDLAIDKRKVDTALLSSLINEARNILNEKIDRLMLVLAKDHPKFYSLYKNARGIDDYQGKTNKQQNIKDGVGFIMGNITALFDESIIEGATIYIMGTDIKETSDEDGFYYIDQVPSGTYTIKITLDTYKELFIKNVVVKPGDELIIDGVLESDTPSI